MNAKIVIADNFVMAEPGVAKSIKRVVDQIAFTKMRLDQDERDKSPPTAAEIGAGTYTYKGLER